MENKTDIKKAATRIVLECKSDPKKIAQWAEKNQGISEELKFELYLRASTLAGRFL